MKKRVVRLNESQLREIISETIRKALSEIDMGATDAFSRHLEDAETYVEWGKIERAKEDIDWLFNHVSELSPEQQERFKALVAKMPKI